MGIRLILFLSGIFLAEGIPYAAFIQSPIPPSLNRNYFRDTDFDGRMDRVEFYFLGNITKENIASTLDSIVFSWIDSAGINKTYPIHRDELQFDSTSARRLFYNLPQPTDTRASLTELNSVLYTNTYGSALLYLTDADSSQDTTDIHMQDGMAPAIKEVSLKSTHGQGTDTLTVTFTESVLENQEGTSLFEFKSSEDSSIHELKHSTLEWGPLNKSVTLTLSGEAGDATRLSPQDSLRLRALALKDSVGNKVPENTPFHLVYGTYPFVIYTNTKAEYAITDSLKRLPVFQLVFAPSGSGVPSASEMGVAVDVGGPETEASVRELLRESRPEQVQGKSLSEISVDPEKLVIHLSLQIFTNQGVYVASTHSETKCSDSRFSEDNGQSCLERARRLFLRWNFMAVNRRLAGTGVYVTKSFVNILYDGLTLYRNDSESNVVQTWGVFRR